MAQNITFLGASYSSVPAVTLPKTGGGTARFDDASVTTATAGDVAQGKVFLASDGTITTGTSADLSQADATPSDVVLGKTFFSSTSDDVQTGSFAGQEKTVTPSTSSQTVTPDSGMFLSSVTVDAISTQTKTVSAKKAAQTITPDSGYLLSSVTVNGINIATYGLLQMNNGAQNLDIDLGATKTVIAINGRFVNNASSSALTVTATCGTSSYTTTSLGSVTVNSSGNGGRGYTFYNYTQRNIRYIRFAWSNTPGWNYGAVEVIYA